VATGLSAENGSVRGKIEGTYAAEPAVALFMPRDMRETYVTKAGTTIDGRASYTRFRRYQVNVDEAIKK
jgi:hypothetical protein